VRMTWTVGADGMNVGRLELICIRRDATRPRAWRTNGSWRASSGRRVYSINITIAITIIITITTIIITIKLSYILYVAKLCTRYTIPPTTYRTPRQHYITPPPAALITHYIVLFIFYPSACALVLSSDCIR
jgi:hypothetical protein